MHITTSDGANEALGRLQGMAAHPAGKTAERAARLAAINAADPEDHPYSGDGTSGCSICRSPMNAHISFATPRRNPCPQCGGPVRNWWSANSRDPGDVDPRADCTNPACDWGY